MYNKEYFDAYLAIIEKDPDKYYKDYLKMLDKVERSNAIYHGKPVPVTYQGLFYDEETRDNFRQISAMLMGITRKVTDHYLKDASYRKVFGFSKDLEELILHDPGYDIPAPICRFDIFYNSMEKFKFVEFNTDGSSAMNEDNSLGPILLDSLAMKELGKDYQLENVDLIDSWVKSSLDIYSRNKSNKPNVAIVDFLDIGTPNEFQAFKEAYEKKGVSCEIVDIRDLDYKDGRLVKGDFPIDLVYRRAVTVEIMKNLDSIQPFIEAYMDNAFLMLGSFRSQLMHVKPIFKILLMDETKAFLSEEERDFLEKSIPKTEIFSKEEDLKKVLANKDGYILKPADSYASQGIYTGRDYTREEFKKILEKILDKDYIYQEYYDMDPLKFIEFDKDGGLHVEDFGVVLGMFIYDEKFVAPYTRIGKDNLISGARTYYTAPNILVKRK